MAARVRIFIVCFFLSTETGSFDASVTSVQCCYWLRRNQVHTLRLTNKSCASWAKFPFIWLVTRLDEKRSSLLHCFSLSDVLATTCRINRRSRKAQGHELLAKTIDDVKLHISDSTQIFIIRNIANW